MARSSRPSPKASYSFTAKHEFDKALLDALGLQAKQVMGINIYTRAGFEEPTIHVYYTPDDGDLRRLQRVFEMASFREVGLESTEHV